MGGMKKDTRLLNMQADRIEAVLHHHHVQVRVTSGLVGPRWIRFNLLPMAGVTISSIRARVEELQLALQARAVRVVQSSGALCVEMSRPDQETITLAGLTKRLKTDRNYGTAVAGLTGEGDVLMIKFWAPDVAHILVTGTTGAGKSALMRTLCLDLAQHNSPESLQFVMIDVKNRPLSPFAQLPHLLTPIIRDSDHAAGVLEQLVALMEERDRLALPITKGDVGEPRILVVIDELMDLAMTGGESVRHSIVRLAQRGREAGIHLLAGTQKPSAQVLSGLALANFPLRIVGKVPTSQEAGFAAGIAGSGAECLSGLGDMLAIKAGDALPFQAAFVTTREIVQAIEALQLRWPSVTLVSLPMPAQQDPAPAQDAQLAEYIKAARSIWQQSLDEGQLRRGAKADIAEVLFGERDTAGHKGKWVDRVINQLQAESTSGFGGGGQPTYWPREPEAVYCLTLHIARFGPLAEHEDGGMAWRIESNGQQSLSDLELSGSVVARSSRTFQRLFAFLELDS